MKTILETNIPGIPCRRGKVRDVYDLGDKLLIVTTDRISAFDSILPDAIPYKGEILTQLSVFWFDFLDICNHFFSADLDEMITYKGVPQTLLKYREVLAGRSMLVGKFNPLPVECIVRGYLSGSAWKEYKKTGMVCGIKLPSGLKENFPLPNPIFTPSTKAEVGHDQNITINEMIKTIGDKEKCEEIIDASIKIYKQAAKYAFDNGIIIADTKFEWSYNTALVLIDEVLTPDSSRFWAVDKYTLGKSIESFDKQFVRDYLTSVGMDKSSSHLPAQVIQKTTEKYLEAYKTLTGKDFKSVYS